MSLRKLRFGSVLPPVLRAIFVSNWDTDQPQLKFVDMASMTKEIQSLRADRNFAPTAAIHDVALALPRNADPEELDRVLSSLPPAVMASWELWSMGKQSGRS